MSIGRRVVLGLVATLLIGVGIGSMSAGAAMPPPPRWVYLTTRPTLPNATFTLDGVAYSTGTDGTVRIPTSKLTSLDQRLGFVSVVNAPFTHANFDRFEAGPEVAFTRKVVAVFDMSRFLHVRTIPVLPHATVLLDGKAYTTGADGTVTIETNRLTDLGHRFRFDTVSTNADTRARFLRFVNPPEHGYWRDAIAVFDLSRAVQFSFTRPDGSAMPTDRVTSMTIRSSTGVQRTLSSSRLRSPVMLPAIHVSSTTERRDEQRIRYTVQEVKVDGSNTVIPSQHAFYPADTTAVAVDTKIYSLHVDVHDALFGFAAGSTVVLQRPDHSEVRYRLAHGKVTIPGVARGQYQLRVEGAGFSGWRPVVVSRDQVVTLSPVSRLDLAAVGALLLLVLIGLFFVGYRLRVRQRSPSARPVDTGVADPWSRPPGPGAPEPVRASEPAG